MCPPCPPLEGWGGGCGGAALLTASRAPCDPFPSAQGPLESLSSPPLPSPTSPHPNPITMHGTTGLFNPPSVQESNYFMKFLLDLKSDLGGRSSRGSCQVSLANWTITQGARPSARRLRGWVLGLPRGMTPVGHTSLCPRTDRPHVCRRRPRRRGWRPPGECAE